jgi:hypothetical protein
MIWERGSSTDIHTNSGIITPPLLGGWVAGSIQTRKVKDASPFPQYIG